MAKNEYAPGSIRLVHGMEHAGLSTAALEIERSRGFKRAFVRTVSTELGFEGVATELAGSGDAWLDSYLDSFGPDGHPPEAETRRYLDSVLAARCAVVGATVKIGEQLRDCCVRFPPDWLNCGGYVVNRDGAPWTIGAAVEEFESTEGPIDDPGVRAELAAICVYVQIEWEIKL